MRFPSGLVSAVLVTLVLTAAACDPKGSEVYRVSLIEAEPVGGEDFSSAEHAIWEYESQVVEGETHSTLEVIVSSDPDLCDKIADVGRESAFAEVVLADATVVLISDETAGLVSGSTVDHGVNGSVLMRLARHGAEPPNVEVEMHCDDTGRLVIESLDPEHLTAQITARTNFSYINGALNTIPENERTPIAVTIADATRCPALFD
jgi:hypothetical protein